MGIQMPMSKKLTLIPQTTIPHDKNSNDFNWLPFYFIIMMPNIIGTITKSIIRHDYSVLLLCVSVFAAFFLLQSCLIKYTSLPKKTDKSRSLKSLLKLNMWFLYTAISFGFVYQFTDLFPSEITVGLYAVVAVCSSFLFYVFVVVDRVRYWRNWRYGEEEREVVPEGRRLDAGKLSRYSFSIMEKV
ncbi:hypothetical protein OSB04_007674 [Centaurea solstitialis]|uniref:Uncharacterized protein n=1 Tax=Centaurea solstitialis TaxID=347529 RepID=A0AA38TKC1_9ASTR|nr:hypothetical protein OSB04_007674 [Centaurea solstitialis]